MKNMKMSPPPPLRTFRQTIFRFYETKESKAATKKWHDKWIGNSNV